MAEQLKIVIDADVVKAMGGLKQLEKSFKTTENSAKSFGVNVAKGTQQATASLAKIPNTANSAAFALTNVGRVAQDLPFGFLGIANNLNPLLESFQRLRAESGSTKKALSSLGSSLMGAGGIGLALSVVSSLLVVFGDRLFKTKKSAEEAESKVKTLNDTLKSIQGDAAKEAANTAGLVAVLKNEAETRERKVAALKELKQIQPEIFGQLKLEGNAVAGLDQAYQAYIQTLRLVITAKLKQAQIEQITQKILEKEGLTLTQSQKDGIKALKDILKPLNDKRDAAIKMGEAGAAGSKFFQQQQDKEAAKALELNNLYKDQAQLFKDLQELSKGIKIKIPEVNAKAVVKEIEFPKITDPINIPAVLDLSFAEDLQKTRDNLFKDANIFGDNTKIIKGIVPGASEDVAKRNKAFFDEFQKQILATADLITGVLAPAFTGMFDAIVAGENPLKAFFNGLKDSVNQLIQKLIQAAIQAAILKGLGFVTSGGATGFGSIFSSLLGGAFGGSANRFGLGGAVGSRAFNNVIQITGGTRISGNDIVLSYNRTNNSNRISG